MVAFSGEVNDDESGPDAFTELNMNPGLKGRTLPEAFSPEEYKNVHMHRIDATDVLDDYEASSRLSAEWDFFVQLRDAGRRTAQSWLAAHYESIGIRGTLDLESALS
jgi:hypothetical protein